MLDLLQFTESIRSFVINLQKIAVIQQLISFFKYFKKTLVNDMITEILHFESLAKLCTLINHELTIFN